MSSSEKAWDIIPIWGSSGLEALFEAGTLAGAFAQVIQAGAADFVVPFYHHLGDARGVNQEGTFHADTVAGNAPDREAGVIARATCVESTIPLNS